MPVTVRGTDILFNDGTTQTTAASPVPSSITAIGSIVFAANWSTSNLVPGNTIAGTSLLYVTGLSAASSISGSLSVQNGVFVAAAVNGNTGFQNRAAEGGLGGSVSGNTGAFQPSNTATLPGTWRVLAPSLARYVVYDGYGYTIIYYYSIVVQRIS